MSIRQDTIKELLKVTYGYLELFLSDDKNVCRQSRSSKECDAITCGSVVIGLNAVGLWPQKSPETINTSVQDLASQLNSLKSWRYYGTNDNHYHCGLNSDLFQSDYSPSASLKGLIASTLSSIPSPVLESHRRHMRIQAMK